MQILIQFLFFVLFYHVMVSSSFSIAKNQLCRDDQSTALLQFKQSIIVDAYASPGCEYLGQTSSSKTESWNMTTDCCRWDGVTCDNLTGQVIGLDVSCNQLQGVIDSNSSLFQLSHLQRLDLSYNDFSSSEISRNFGELTSLTHLNLTSSRFSGQLPTEFLRLSNLISIDLSNSGIIKVDPPTFRLLLQNLTRLRDVSLSGINISSTFPSNISNSIAFLDLANTNLYGDLPDRIFHLPNLQRLQLSNNRNLSGQLTMIKWNSSSNLRYLDIFSTDLSGEIPQSIGNLKLLNHLDLSYCNFWGSIPESLGNLTRLNNLVLSGNNFVGPIPSTFSGLDQLIRLYLHRNALQGQIPNSWGNFRMLTDLTLSDNFLTGPFPSSFTNLTKLLSLDLSNNSLSGPISPVHVLGFPNLTFLSLAKNSFNGTIPSWLFSLPSLQRLSLRSNELTGKMHDFQSHSLKEIDLSENKLCGPIPNSLSKLNNLTDLDISSNNFSGDIDISMFSNMKQLENLDLSFNNLSLTNNEANTTIMFKTLFGLHLASCGITNLDFLRGAMNLEYLHLSNNMIHGELPKWMGYDYWSERLFYLNLSNNFLTSMNHLPQGLSYLDLSSNSLQGPIFTPPIHISFFFASNNNLSGEIPSSLCKLTSLDAINLSNNRLSGVIPQCLGNGSNRLTVLDFHMNRLQGNIPDTFGVGSNLRSLNLRDNQLEGTVPKSLSNCRELEVLDLRNNFLNGTFPSWLGILPKLQVLSLRSNNFYSPISTTSTGGAQFIALRIIDLSNNQFNGILPARFFRSLEGMKRVDSSSFKVYIGGLNYYDSVVMIIKGNEIQLVRILSVWTTIDLSNNKFEGEIPYEIGELLALRGLNLSHNILGGGIPSAFGNLKVIESLDLSSNKLSGGIPQQLKAVTTLAVLNLSENHLVGSIPQGNQFATFKNESYIGNSGLCGFPLSKSCEDEGLPKSSPPVSSDENYEGFFDGFTWQSVLTGYGVGMGIGVGAASLMFFTGKPKWFSEFVKKHGFKRRRRRVEIKRNF